MLFVVLIYLHNYIAFMIWHSAKKARHEENTGSLKPKAQENGADAKQSIEKDELKGKSKSKKGDDKVKNTQSQTEAPKGKLHSDVLVLLQFLFLLAPVKIPYLKPHFYLFVYSTCSQHVNRINVLNFWLLP